MKKVILGSFLVAFAAFSTACSPCCGCTTADSESLIMLLAGEKVSDDNGIAYVSAEQVMEVR